MKKNFWIKFGLIHLALVAVFLVVYFVLPVPIKEGGAIATETIAPIVESTSNKAVTLDLDLEFDNIEDIREINFIGHNDLQDANPEKAWKQEGYIGVGMGTPFSFVSVLRSLKPGQFVHFRTRTGDNSCDFVGIEVDLQDSSKEFRLDGCTGGSYEASAVYNLDNFGNSLFGSMPLSGSVPALEVELVDRIIWLNETGNQLYYVITNTNDPSNVMVGAVQLPDDWQYDRWNIGAGGFFDYDENGQANSFVDIELIRVGTGSLLDYLAEYVPAYQENQEELIDLFAQEPELLSELHPDGWQEQAADMDGEEMGMAADDDEAPNNGEASVDGESSDMEIAEDGHTASESFGVLTWPDPEPILPYLITLDNIDRCNNCENQVHGVILTPNGYSFIVAYGNPEDSGPPGENSRVKHWVKIYSETADLDEILFMAKISNYRIPPFNAGEPAQLISGTSAATNLLLTKANVVMMTHVDNAGKNARIARNILDATFPLVPEDGLVTPELVPEPSVAFNAQKADEVLERAWMGSFENWQNETDSFSGRSAMWVRLKAPAEKVEVAVYHPQSQTYLSYFWMDNPQVGVDLWMMPENPDGYYFGHYEGEEFVVRVWVDGELVAEFPVRK